jgi:flagellar motor switch protein FliN/FliY
VIAEWSRTCASAVGELCQRELAVEWDETREVGPEQPADPGTAWWEFSLDGEDAAKIWIGAPNATATQLNSLARSLDPGEPSSPDQEGLLPVALTKTGTAFAARLSERIGRKIGLGEPRRLQEPPEATHSYNAFLRSPDGDSISIVVAVDGAMAQLAGGTAGDDETPVAGSASERRVPRATEKPSSAKEFDFYNDVELPIAVVFGRTELTLERVAGLGPGSVLELDCEATDPVEIVVNDRVIATGSVVVIDGNYGIEIQDLAFGRGDR